MIQTNELFLCKNPTTHECRDFSADMNTCKTAITQECSLISGGICKNILDNTCSSAALKQC